MHRAHITSGGRYPVLRALGILYMVGAVGVLCYGLYNAGYYLFAKLPLSFGERLGWAGWYVVGTFMAVVTTFAVAELIKLLIDIERNTRMAAMNGGAPSNGTQTAEGATPHVNRITAIEEESAEEALIKGH